MTLLRRYQLDYNVPCSCRLKAPLHDAIRPHGSCRLPCTWVNRNVWHVARMSRTRENRVKRNCSSKAVERLYFEARNCVRACVRACVRVFELVGGYMFLLACVCVFPCARLSSISGFTLWAFWKWICSQTCMIECMDWVDRGLSAARKTHYPYISWYTGAARWLP